ncbi:MAG: ATP-dependent helicase [Candidatus Brockarchaeota archaeon]|nr:ATP-dependent helicase [Candidatus Brockarchaeota archaeon]
MSGEPYRFYTVKSSLEDVVKILHPIVGEWLRSRFKGLSPPQSYGIMPIRRGENTLISAPTGSGKTLACFLTILDDLIKMGFEGRLEDRVYCVYVSPLRSLNNDVRKNLSQPLEELRRLAEEKGVSLPEIRIHVRTGDTKTSERGRMLKKPPHILITTPESLSIILVAPKFRSFLKGVKWVVVDEIHELCSSKRGAHLSLSLERLRSFSGQDFQRIGLSATIHPLEKIAAYLAGYEDSSPRPCTIVDVHASKKFELKVVSPHHDLVHTPAEELSRRMYRLINEIIKRNRTTLIFTNTRSSTERVVYHLKKLRPKTVLSEDEYAAHHSSLSREVRLDVEDRLKKGRLKAVVTSTSLELGIDIGFIDCVVQIGSPKSVTRAIQRVGRSGHSLEAVSKGIFIPMERDDLLEVLVMSKAAEAGKLDEAYIPENPLDVLAQHIVGMAVERKWRIDEAYGLVRRSYNFRNLGREDFVSVLRYLSGYYRQLEGYKVYGKIWLDEADGVFGRRGNLARVIYMTNTGTIPDMAMVKVFTRDNRPVGNIEEEFFERLSPGDIFLLGGRPYRCLKSRLMKLIVEPAEGEKPTVPQWFSEMLPLSYDLASMIDEFRIRELQTILFDRKEDRVKQYMEYFKIDRKTAVALYDYLRITAEYFNNIGILPYIRRGSLIVENYVDVSGRQIVVFHSLVGRRVNDVLSRAFAVAASNLLGTVSIQIAVSDNGFLLILPPKYRVDPEKIVRSVNSSNLQELVVSSIEKTDMLKHRFRHVAVRSFMILRNYKGHEVMVSKLQLNSEHVLKAVKDLKDFPVMRETYREILEDVMDIKNAMRFVTELEKGVRSPLVCRPNRIASPLSHSLLVSSFSDVVLMEDKRTLLERLHREVLAAIHAAD